MKSIHKYKLDLEAVAKGAAVPMPQGASILTVQVQYEAVCLWAAIDPDAPIVPRTIVLVGTGHGFFDGAYIGTVQLRGGALVLHVFDGGDVS